MAKNEYHGQILYGVDVSFADPELNDPSKKCTEENHLAGNAVIDKLTGDRKFHDFGRLLNDTLHKRYPDTNIEILHASVNNIGHAGYWDEDIQKYREQWDPKFTVQVRNELSSDECHMLTDAVNTLIEEKLSDSFAPNGTCNGMRRGGNMAFYTEWDPDKVKQYFEEKAAEDEAFADAVANITEKNDLAQ